MQRALASRFLVGAAVVAARLANPVPDVHADPNGIPLCTLAGDQLRPVIASDGQGGAVVAWHDQRPGAPAGGVIYAQRVDATGALLWTPGGVQLSTSGDVNDPVIAPDGGGGAYFAFGGQGTAPRAQHVNSAGAVQWGADGLTLSLATTQARELAIASDPLHGDLLVAWRQDNGNGGTSDVFAQRVSFGVIQWNPGGQAIANLSTSNEVLPAVVSDGAGGAVIAWIDATAGGVKIQGFKSNGTGAWSRFPLSTAANNMAPVIIRDGEGGTIVGWAEGGSLGNFMQRVSGLGTKLWSSAGIPLSTGGNTVNLLPDGFGGAIATWQDFRSGTNYNVYAQGVTSGGSQAWTANGAPVCTATQDQKLPQIVTDGAGGAIITWFDYRFNATGADIYAQRISPTGTAVWTPDGIPLCTAPDAQEYPTIASDGAGGAYVAWQDRRNGTDYDTYLQRVGGDASTLSVPPASGSALRLEAWPNPFSDRVQLDFALPFPARVREAVVDVSGRTVRDLGFVGLAGGAHELRWDGRTNGGRPAEEGIYFLRVTGPGIELARRVVRLQ